MPAPDGSPATVSSDGAVAQINLLLNTSPYSNAALDLAGDDLRRVAHAEAPDGTTALVTRRQRPPYLGSLGGRKTRAGAAWRAGQG
ncbi:hypothetical protein O7614_10490 [Micromonospora sp. WMMD961]|uniref:hypothetical protein n=1 Tax=Micromonospora sp. WMMD961 TaxID=3016100 RepID=UPI0024166C03|nr:hypothetical protein [Micromonospora sp. WMMD961]MDG4780068.1 hypothetical protein [Micromonospora sp. WMMD961]